MNGTGFSGHLLLRGTRRVWSALGMAWVGFLLAACAHPKPNARRVAECESTSRAPSPHPAEFSLHVPNPSYAHEPAPPQKERPVRRIHEIVAPVLGMPTLASCGGMFDILVYAPRLPQDSDRPEGWKVSLYSDLARKAAVHNLRPERVRRRGAFWQLRVRVPLLVAPDVYHLRLRGPAGLRDLQYRAVRVFCPAPKTFRFAVFTDHQLWDPTWKLASGLRAARGWPRRGQEHDNKAVTLQEFHELELLDPLFALHLGDLVFGLDYGREYSLIYDWWKFRRLAVFQVPGNHDAYARFTLKIRGNLTRIGGAFWKCRDRLPREKSWMQVLAYLECVYGDVKRVLFSNLVHDGLASYVRTFGPPYYSFDLGRFHFVALNTYDGTRQRRHALSVWIPIMGLHLGAPATDNYGGYLSVPQLEWLERDLERAAARGQTLVVFGHHDPRGNLRGRRYHANEPFPTHPIGPNHFEEWNYDGAWDSNPNDSRGRETPRENSGTRLLALLARYGGYYISGHVHVDGQRTYRPGESILPNIIARRPLTFVRVTTAAAGVRDHGYWGYRVLTARADGTLDVGPHDEDAGLLSVPAGRFWMSSHPEGTAAVARLTIALRRPLPVHVRFRLAFLARGYRFSVSPQGSARVRLLDATPDPNTRLGTYLLAVRPTGTGLVQVRADVARGNRPPHLVLRISSGDRSRSLSARSGSLVLQTCSPVTLDTSASRDPDGDALLGSFLRVQRLCPKELDPVRLLRDPRGLRPCGLVAAARSARVVIPARRGAYLVEARIQDAHGAPRDLSLGLLLLPRAPRTASGGRKAWIAPAMVLALLMAGAGIWLVAIHSRRRKRPAGDPRAPVSHGEPGSAARTRPRSIS